MPENKDANEIALTAKTSKVDAPESKTDSKRSKAEKAAARAERKQKKADNDCLLAEKPAPGAAEITQPIVMT